MVWKCPRGRRGSLRRGEAGEFESQPMHAHSPATGTISPKKLSQALETRGSHVAHTTWLWWSFLGAHSSPQRCNPGRICLLWLGKRELTPTSTSKVLAEIC